MNEFLQKVKFADKLTQFMELEAAKMVVNNQINIFNNIMQTDNDRIVWSNMVMPTELIFAFNLIPLQTELVSGWLSTLNLSKKYIHTAHSKKYNINVCSYHKAIIGCLEEGILKPPIIAVFSSHICDGGSMMGTYLKKRFNTKVKLIQVPYSVTVQNRQFLESQLTELKEWMEAYVGYRLTNENLKSTIEFSHKAREYFIKANNIRKSKTVFMGNLSIRNMYGATFLMGSELGVKVAKKYYWQLKNKQKVECKKRILWVHFAPLHNGQIMKFFEEELGCVIVFDITSFIYWDKFDENGSIEILSQKILSHYYLGEAKKRINLYLNIVEQYNVDGIVIFMHNGCKAIPCSAWELKEVSKLTNKPLLELYGDCINPEGISTEQMKLRMEAFKEGLERE